MSSSPPELGGGLELTSPGARAQLRLAPAQIAPGRRRPAPGYAATLVVADLLALGAALGVLVALVGVPAHGGSALAEAALLAGALLLVLTLIGAYGLYDGARRGMAPTGLNEVGRLFHALLVAAFALVIAGRLLHGAGDWVVPGPLDILLFLTLSLVTVSAGRTLVRAWAPTAAPARRVLVLGDGEAARRLATKIESYGCRGTTVVGFVTADGHGPGVIGQTADLARHVEDLEVDCVVLTSHGASDETLLERVRALRRPGLQVSIVPEYFQIFTANASLEDVAGVPVLNLPPVRLSPSARAVKRAIDLVVASVGLLVLAPLLALVALLIKLDSQGPVLFRQARHGRRGREFRICKFRTMYQGAEAQRHMLAHLNEMVDGGPLFKIREDPRVTRVGAVLRKLSVDELPQLWNVVRGEMSLVGPRPFVVHESERITGWGERRLDTTPGITGLWQVLGRNDLSFEEMLQLDYVYVTNWSPWWDLKILCQTVPAVLGGRGAY
jgi:exopolysaccharide biosynthesis polyprenyl glycosylphosphotransferase